MKNLPDLNLVFQVVNKEIFNNKLPGIEVKYSTIATPEDIKNNLYTVAGNFGSTFENIPLYITLNLDYFNERLIKNPNSILISVILTMSHEMAHYFYCIKKLPYSHEYTDGDSTFDLYYLPRIEGKVNNKIYNIFVEYERLIWKKKLATLIISTMKFFSEKMETITQKF